MQLLPILELSQMMDETGGAKGIRKDKKHNGQTQ